MSFKSNTIQITAFALLALPTSFCIAEEATTQPTLKVGETWEMHRIDGYNNSESNHYRLTVKSVSQDIITYDGTNKKGDYTWQQLTDLNPFKWIDKAAGKKEIYKRLTWPLTPGQSWDYPYTDGNHHNLTAHVSVMGWEKISTPAGEFNAVKISYKGRWENNDSQTGNWQQTDWYSPSAKWVVKKEYKDFNTKGGTFNWWSEELLSYKVQN